MLNPLFNILNLPVPYKQVDSKYSLICLSYSTQLIIGYTFIFCYEEPKHLFIRGKDLDFLVQEIKEFIDPKDIYFSNDVRGNI